MPSTPASCQSRSRSGGAAKSVYMRVAVRAVPRHHVVGRDHVAQALRHLGAILDHHALGEQTTRPARRSCTMPRSRMNLGPEARINQVQNRVLDAANVLVDGEPVVDGRGIQRRLVSCGLV